jgi:xanthine dehydrogenase YagR molybdenum-binding subunit
VCERRSYAFALVSVAAVLDIDGERIRQARIALGAVAHKPWRVSGAKDGRLVALRHDTVEQTSSFDEYVEGTSLPARSLYACPNVGTSHRLVRVDTETPSFMRAPGEAPGTFGL